MMTTWEAIKTLEGYIKWARDDEVQSQFYLSVQYAIKHLKSSENAVKAIDYGQTFPTHWMPLPNPPTSETKQYLPTAPDTKTPVLSTATEGENHGN